MELFTEFNSINREGIVRFEIHLSINDAKYFMRNQLIISTYTDVLVRLKLVYHQTSGISKHLQWI